MEPAIIVLTALSAITLFIVVIFLFIIVRKGYDFQLLCGFVLSFLTMLTLLATLLEMTHASGNYLTALKIHLFLLHLNLIAIICTLRYLVKDKKNKLLFAGIIISSVILITIFSVPNRIIYHVDSGYSFSFRALIYIWLLTVCLFALTLIIKNKARITIAAFLAISAGIFLLLLALIAPQAIDVSSGNPVQFLPYSLFGCFIMITYFLFNHMLNELIQRKPFIMKEAGWEHIFDRLDVIAVVLDRMGHVESMNPYFYQLTGFREEEVIGKDWFAFFLPQKAHYDVQSAFIEIIEFEFHPRYRNPIVTKNNEEKIIDWHNIRILDTDGHVSGSLSIGVDLTEDLTECENSKKKLRDAEELINQLRAGRDIS